MWRSKRRRSRQHLAPPVSNCLPPRDRRDRRPSKPSAAAPSPSAGISGRPDAAAVVAIWDSLERLRELRAYRFTLGLSGVSPLHLEESSNGSIGVRGSLVQKPVFAIDGVFATQLVEFGGAAGVSGSQRFVIVGDTYWETRPGESPAPRPAGPIRDELLTLLPDGMATRLIIPFAAGFEDVGIENAARIDTIHYRMTDQGEHVYANATGCVGDWSGDVWVIEDGRYLGEANCAARRRIHRPDRTFRCSSW